MSFLNHRTFSAAGLVSSTLATLLAGCATVVSAPPGQALATGSAQVALPPATPATPPAAAPAPAAAASAPPALTATSAAAARPPAVPGAPPPFAEATREAKRSDGFLPVWTRDDKTWLEIPAALLDKPMFFASSIASGLGERFFYPGLMGREHIVMLRRVGNTVQLVARNQHARAPAGTPLARAVAES